MFSFFRILFTFFVFFAGLNGQTTQLELPALEDVVKSLIIHERTETSSSKPYVYNPYVPQNDWDVISPLFLPLEHPIKPKLDAIFEKSRAIKDINALKKAGFTILKKQKWTKIIVATHPQVPGYIFKIYLDKQSPHQNRAEYYYWTLRIAGAKNIQNFITEYHLEHLFKVPTKWMYPLPIEPSPPSDMVRKNFILVEDDMDIYPDIPNKFKWRSNAVNRDLLILFFHLVSTLGLLDSAKPQNAPFSKDGRIAFIDTQIFYCWPIAYQKLTPFLSPEMQAIWLELTDGIK